jgi:hypothetical protein
MRVGLGFGDRIRESAGHDQIAKIDEFVVFMGCWARGHRSAVGMDWLFVFWLDVKSPLGSVLKKRVVRS